MNDDTEVATPTTAPKSPPPSAATPAADEPYHHARWLKALTQPGGPGALRLPLSKMQTQILIHTHQHVNYNTGETFVSAHAIAKEVQHESPKHVWVTWSLARKLGVLSDDYAKPNEPAYKKFRRLRCHHRGCPSQLPNRELLRLPGAPEVPIRERSTPKSVVRLIRIDLLNYLFIRTNERMIRSIRRRFLKRAAASVTSSPQTPAYAHQNQQNQRVSDEVAAIERRIDQARIRLATIEPAKRRKLVRQAIQRDAETAVRTYRAGPTSLLSDLKRRKQAGRDPFASPRLLAMLAELLELES